MIVFDLLDWSSFDHVRRWEDELRETVRRDAVLALVGNKADEIGGGREVTAREALAFAAAHRMLYFETSARTGEGVQEALAAIMRAAEGLLEASPGLVSRLRGGRRRAAVARVLWQWWGRRGRERGEETGGAPGPSGQRVSEIRY